MSDRSSEGNNLDEFVKNRELHETVGEDGRRSFSIRPAPQENQPSSIWEQHEKELAAEPKQNKNTDPFDELLSPQHEKVKQELKDIREKPASDYMPEGMEELLKKKLSDKNPDIPQGKIDNSVMDALKMINELMKGKCTGGHEADCTEVPNAPNNQQKGSRSPAD